jgi:hypothetical protein
MNAEIQLISDGDGIAVIGRRALPLVGGLAVEGP